MRIVVIDKETGEQISRERAKQILDDPEFDFFVLRDNGGVDTDESHHKEANDYSLGYVDVYNDYFGIDDDFAEKYFDVKIRYVVKPPENINWRKLREMVKNTAEDAVVDSLANVLLKRSIEGLQFNYDSIMRSSSEWGIAYWEKTVARAMKLNQLHGYEEKRDKL